MAGIAGATMKPARRREVEMGGGAAGLQEHGRETVERGGLFGDPQRVRQLLRLRDQEAGGVDAVEKTDARRIGQASLAKAFGHADPQKRSLARFEDKPDEGQREAGCGARVAGLGSMDFGEARRRQAAAQRRIETLSPGGEQVAIGHSAMPDEVDILGFPAEAFGKAAFDLRDLTAQGRNGSTRHGRRCHDVQLFRNMFLLCSNRFQSPSEESSGLPENLFLFWAGCFP